MEIDRILLDLFVFAVGAWVALNTIRSLRSGKTYSKYGPALSTDRKTEPTAYWFVILWQTFAFSVFLGIALWDIWVHFDP